MLKKSLFRKPKNQLEDYYQDGLTPHIRRETIKCPKCNEEILSKKLEENYHICPKCSYYFRLSSRQRIRHIADENSFTPLFEDLYSKDPLCFPDYAEKLKKAEAASGEKEAVVCGIGEINGFKTAIFAMEPYFMMGSMGTVVGEKITLLFEYATEHSLPVVGFTVSGGARMQEGILSLMQMAKTSGAVQKHSEAKNFYLTVLTDPTTGGVTASFAMEGDIILAEPGALIAFAGPRVIEQTIRRKLPLGFQKAEFLLEKGFVDNIIPREEQKPYIARLLALHSKAGGSWEGRADNA